MGGVDLQKATRENVRWYILRALNAARPEGASESIVLSALQGIPIDITQKELRRELDYLEARDLIEVEGRKTPVWYAKTNRDGIDVVEYTVECHPGIARPEKWWDD